MMKSPGLEQEKTEQLLHLKSACSKDTERYGKRGGSVTFMIIKEREERRRHHRRGVE